MTTIAQVNRELAAVFGYANSRRLEFFNSATTRMVRKMLLVQWGQYADRLAAREVAVGFGDLAFIVRKDSVYRLDGVRWRLLGGVK